MENLINNFDEFYEDVKDGDLCEFLFFSSAYHGKDLYFADTNGNDDKYSLYIFADEDAIYWGEAILTVDDLERNGENAMPEWDEYMYKYKTFPVDKDELIKFIKEKVKNGVQEGSDALNNFESNYLELDIPTYALTYLIYGDSSALENDEIKMIDKWYKDLKVTHIEVTDRENEFDTDPAFGEPCATTECKVYTQGN
jgi:hypothetical protein